MQRYPVLLQLALITVSLFAEDVKFLVHSPVAAAAEAAVTSQADTSTPLAAIQLIDAEQAIAEITHNGRTTRGTLAKPFATLSLPLNAACAGNASSFSMPFPASTSLVSRHVRLQI